MNKVLFLIEGADLESTKQDILKIVDPDGASESGKGEVRISKDDLVTRLHVEFHRNDMHIMIPMNIFEGLNINIDHPAAIALMNAIVVQGKKYVFLDDDVAQLAVQQCSPSA